MRGGAGWAVLRGYRALPSGTFGQHEIGPLCAAARRWLEAVSAVVCRRRQGLVSLSAGPHVPGPIGPLGPAGGIPAHCPVTGLVGAAWPTMGLRVTSVARSQRRSRGAPGTRRRSGLAGAPSTTLWSIARVRSSTSRIATRPSTTRGRWVIPPTMTSRDIKVRGVMPKPPPSANIPTAVTPTVPMRCRAVTDRRHHGIHCRYRARNASRGRCGSFQPSAAAAGRWLALDAVQLGGEIGHLADVGVAQDMGHGERALRGRDLDHGADIDSE